jgi:endonuclease/exonuclease/phosphatase family metal-dependent hydrolase
MISVCNSIENNFLKYMKLAMLKKYLFLIIIIYVLSPEYGFSQSLNLMTYNIRLDVAVDGVNKWDNRKEVFAAQIKFYEPDVLGIQESMPNQVSYLDSNLTNYKHIGIAREGVGKGEASPIFYNTQRLSLVTQNTFWLSETPEKISKGWDASYLRVCTYALFADIKTRRKFWVFNTHLDNDGEVARKKSIELILKKVQTINTKNYPFFLMGDFNATPETAVIVGLKKIMNDSKDVSVAKPFGPQGSFNNFEFDKPVTMLIDYIFVTKSADVVVNKYAVLSDSYNLKYPSDHLPVFVQVKLVKKYN